MAEQSHKKNSGQIRSFETPKDGDWISVSFDGHRDSWWGPLYYREAINDPEKGIIERACVLTETWSEPGKLSVLFERVEFWSLWEGESSKEYEERKKRIIAELQIKKIPIDPIDSFIGENAIQGTWSTPKIGPAFEGVQIEDNFTRPEDGYMVEVHARNYVNTNVGIYLSGVDRIYSRNRVIEKAILLGEGAGEVQYGNRFRYGVPMIPFSEWIRFRVLNDDGTPESDWMQGPHFEEWNQKEKARRMREEAESNTKAFLQLKEFIEKELRDSKSTAECIVILREQLGREEDVPLPNRELYINLLRKKLEHFKEVLKVEKDGPDDPSEEIPALIFPYQKEDLYKVVRRIEPQLTPETFYKRLSRGADSPNGPVVEGVPIEMSEIAGVVRISKKSFEYVKEVVMTRLKADAGWRDLI